MQTLPHNSVVITWLYRAHCLKCTCYIENLSLKGQCHENFNFRFFHAYQFPPKPVKIALRSFHIFSKIRGDICKSRCTIGFNDTGGKFAAGVKYTGGKFAIGFNNIGGKFATGLNDTGSKFVTSVNDTGDK